MPKNLILANCVSLCRQHHTVYTTQTNVKSKSAYIIRLTHLRNIEMNDMDVVFGTYDREYGQAQQNRRTYRIEGNEIQTESRLKREREMQNIHVCSFLWSSLAHSLFTLCAICGNTYFAII